MNGEIGKILMVKNALPEDEKSKIDNALEVIRQTFHKMVGAIGVSIKTDAKAEYTVDDLLNALKTIKEAADKTGVAEIPAIDNVQDAKIYVMKFGMEMLK